MSEREKILRYYRASGDEASAAKLLDLGESAIRYRRYKVSDFLDPYLYSIAETITAHYDQLQLLAEGGYHGAERVKAAFIDLNFPGKVDFAIAALRIDWDSRYYQLSHRDVLGALLGLGLKREIIGDLIMNQSGCQVILDTTMAAFVVQNLSTVGSAPVSVTTIALEEIAAREEKIKEIKTTVASLRLDVVAAAGFGTSRTKMADEIMADKVKVNWQSIKNSSQLLKIGDVISMHGRGRVEVCDVLGQTKKGRTSVCLKRFI
ncbi:MAG: YlmH/Sll1252 family protein [Veillonellales bacterium]